MATSCTGKLWMQGALLAACLGLAAAAGCQREEAPKSKDVAPPEPVAKSEPEKPKAKMKLTGRQVFERMVAAYQKASSYADEGTIHLLATAGGEKMEEKKPFSLAMVRPDKLRLEAYEAVMVCDGKDLYAAINDLPGQVLHKPAPARLTLATLFQDQIFAEAWTQSFGGAMPQAMLLLGDKPLENLLRDADEVDMSEPGEIEGRACYRVKIKRPDGTATFWIDRESLVLRRIVLPTDLLRQEIGREKRVESLSLVADFTGARIDGRVDPKAFAFEAPRGVEMVKFFLPPPMLLLGKKSPALKFYDLDGKPVSLESLLGKVVLLDFWATWCGPCRESLPELEKVYQRYKGNPKVAFCAVSVDGRDTKNKEIVKTFEELKVKVPVYRDTDQQAPALKFPGIPATFLIGSDGLVQNFEAGFNPKLAEALPAKIDALLAGESIFAKSLQEYQEQAEEYAKMAEAQLSSEVTPSKEQLVEELAIPKVKAAPRSQPARFKLTPLWKCADLKSPGNIVVVSEKSGPARLLVVDNWDSVAEVGLDGKVIARHKLKLGDKEFIGRLRVAAGADGRRYVVAFLTAQQRCHVLDDRWNLVADYPEDALKNPHSGIADVELGDLDGDGRLKMYVGYLGIVGVQALPLPPDGTHRLWSNRSLSNVGAMAVGGPDQKGRRDLFCTNNSGSLVVLDAEGQRVREISVPNRMLGWIAAADLRGDGQPLWCGLAASQLGENVAIGLSLKGDELWNYRLPEGLPAGPIELIVPGKLTRDGPVVWLLPAPDGSIHIVSADGRPLDKFNYGAALQGLATVEIDGQPVLVVSTPDGLEAWKVE